MKNDNHSYKKAVIAGQFVKEEEYWMNKLSGEITKSFFPYDYKKDNKNKHNTGEFKFKLTGEIFSKLMKLRNGSDPRLHMILITGMVILLNKLTGNTDIIIGSPSLKQEFDVKFLNTVLVQRNIVEDNMTFKELLLNIRQTVIEATKNQNYPVETLPYRLNMSFSEKDDFPLFDVAVLVKNIHYKKYIDHIHLNMIFSFLRLDESIEGVVDFNSFLYNRATIERIVCYYKQLFQTALTNIDIQISVLDILPEQERRRILFDFNNNEQLYPGDKTIHELFEEQVEKTPDNIALHGCMDAWMQGGGHMTYCELNERSNQLAHVLREKGVIPDTIVGIIIEPCIEMINGLMGILKSGGAYLPIEPEHPVQRKRYILKDGDVKILLTQEKYLDDYIEDYNVINLNSEDTYTGISENFELEYCSNNLAYVLYTSGTTGIPKGVLVEHRNILNYIYWRINKFNYTPKDTSLQMISLSFDAFCSNFYPGILTGGKIALVDNSKQLEYAYIKELINREQITNFSIVPSVYKLILENSKGHELDTIRFVVLGGEKANPDLIALSETLFPEIDIINEYGPTECSVTSTAYCNVTSERPSIIGMPISNTHIHILDGRGYLRPLGIGGELCISGPGLARGYLNRTGLTKEKFVENPFLPLKGEKMYKTGDLARWLPDGNVEFLGRRDNQVKIRGYRIELGEIESQLLNDDKVKEAVILAKESDKGGKYLCAYIVGKEEQRQAGTGAQSDKSIDFSEIKKKLSENLPDYMIPSYFVQLDEIPLTPNGKVDRNALPEPEINAEEDYIAPRNEIEIKLVEIWSDVLKIDQEVISINSNFFEFGGQSLTATILTSKIDKELNVRVPLVKMFKTPTIIGLSGYIKEAGKNENRINDENLVLLKLGISKTDHIFFIHDGTGEVEGYIELCGNLNNHFNCWGIKADRLKDLMPRNLTINNIAREYIKKIKKVQPNGRYCIAGWSLGGTIAYEIVRQLEESDESVRFFAMIDTYTLEKDLSESVREFSMDTELELIQNLLKKEDAEISEKLKQGIEFEEIWVQIVDYLEANKNRQEIIDNVITEYNIRRFHPDIEQFDIREQVYYINILRSINNAWMSYIPERKVNSFIHFFKANGTIHGPFQLPWNYNSKESIITHELPGDHFSILTAPNVINLAKEFDKAMNLESRTSEECERHVIEIQ